jgi:hypothetical protein
MSKKAQQNAAAKRARRNTASKVKRSDRNAKGVKVLPGRRPTRGNETLTALAQALSRSNLDDPLQYILAGGKGEGEFNPQSLIKTSRKAVGEVYKLFSYVTLAERLVQEKAFVHEFACDLDRVTNELIEIDRQVMRLPKLAEIDLESFTIDMLDIGGYVENLADQLYTEIEALEKHSFVIEDRLNKAAHDFQVSHPEVTEQDARLVIMETISQERVNKFRQLQQEAETAEV